MKLNWTEMKIKMLVLTDHSGHNRENSLYPMVREMILHPSCAYIDIVSRSDDRNFQFFENNSNQELYGVRADTNFDFDEGGKYYTINPKKCRVDQYDIVWLRMPPPLSEKFLNFLDANFPNQLFINNPIGIKLTGSKEFLLNFKEFCPPMKKCKCLYDIEKFKQKFPIVLKPFNDYGGKGIVKIDGDKVWEGNEETTFDAFSKRLRNHPIEYLGVKFLENVRHGDKRIIVVDGQILGASLRLPAPDSWLCNIAMGGVSQEAQPDEDEIAIIEAINPVLSQMGIVMYGVDTLENSLGRRLLSEINTTSIGGLHQIGLKGEPPILPMVAKLLWNYIESKTTHNVY